MRLAILAARPLKKLLVALASVVVTLLVAEGAHRVWLALRGEPYDAPAALDELERIADPARWYVPDALDEDEDPQGFVSRGLPLLHPYTGAENAHDTGGVLAAFREGFAPDEYTVVVVGGSVAAGWARGEGEAFARRLEQDPRFAGRRVRVLNYAHAAYKQPQQLMRVAYLFSLGGRPDAVLALDGFNEVALSLQSLDARTHPLYPATPLWGLVLRSQRLNDDEGLARAVQLWKLRDAASGIIAAAREHRLLRSSVLGRILLARMKRIEHERARLYQRSQASLFSGGKTRRERSAFRRQLGGPDFDAAPAAVLETCARNWAESSISLNALCTAREIYYLHALQPTLHDVGAKPLSPEELALGPIPDGWLEGPRDGYPLLRARVPELEAHGVRFFDASRIFEAHEEQLYIDHCHVNQRGNRLLTEALAQGFLEHLP